MFIFQSNWESVKKMLYGSFKGMNSMVAMADHMARKLIEAQDHTLTVKEVLVARNMLRGMTECIETTRELSELVHRKVNLFLDAMQEDAGKLREILPDPTTAESELDTEQTVDELRAWLTRQVQKEKKGEKD